MSELIFGAGKWVAGKYQSGDKGVWIYGPEDLRMEVDVDDVPPGTEAYIPQIVERLNTPPPFPPDASEVSRLTAALAEAQAREAALKGEMERLRGWLREQKSEGVTPVEKLDAAVKRAEEAAYSKWMKRAVAAEETLRDQAAVVMLGLAYDKIRQRAEASEARLSLAERVVEAAGPLLTLCWEQRLHDHTDELGSHSPDECRHCRARAALSEYRKAVGK